MNVTSKLHRTSRRSKEIEKRKEGDIGYQEVRGVTVSRAGERVPPYTLYRA